MANNRTFFRMASQGHMTLRDIFSDVLKKHTPDDAARVLIAGTSLTTPDESQMLSQWQKPFLFFRFFLVCCLTVLGAWVLVLLNLSRGYDCLMMLLSAMVPMTVLLLTWEMNIPRSISLIEVMKIVAVGGILSIIFTILFEYINPMSGQGAHWAPITEEPGKLVIILLILRKKNYKYITEGILLGMAVGTGFAIMETMSYILDSMRQGMIMAALSVPEYLNLMFEELNTNGVTAKLYYMIEAVAWELFEIYGAENGIRTAILRAVNAVAGHGMLAAFYGGGLMIAKGSESFRISHLANKHFLFYFAVSFILHFLNNFDPVYYIFPTLFNGTISSYSFFQTAVAIFLFLPLLRRGVNQVVDTTLQHHGGRLTMAVESSAPPVRNQESAPQYNHQSAPAMLCIQVTSGPHKGQTLQVPEGQAITIGRTPGSCQLALPQCSKISGRHCAVRLSQGTIALMDLDSTNGTYLTGQRLTPRTAIAVSSGSPVTLGSQDCVIQFSIG